MKEILSKVKMNFNLNKQVFILAAIIYIFLVTIGFSLSLIFPLMDMLTIIFVMCPFAFTFSYLAAQSSERVLLDNNDVYYGYKTLGSSFFYVIRRTFIPVVISFVIGMGVYFVFATLDLLFIDNEYYAEINKLILNNKLTNVNDIIVNYPDMVNRLMYCLLIGLGGMIVAFNIFGNNKIMSYIFYLKIKKSYINYDFLIKINQKKYQYKTFWLDVLFSLFNVVGLVLAVLINVLLSNVLNNISLLFLISIFIYFLISTICLPFKYLLYSEKFNKSFIEELERFKEMNN